MIYFQRPILEWLQTLIWEWLPRKMMATSGVSCFFDLNTFLNKKISKKKDWRFAFEKSSFCLPFALLVILKLSTSEGSVQKKRYLKTPDFRA